MKLKVFFYTRTWYDTAEVLIVVGITVVIGLLLCGISYGTGYLLMDVLEWVTVDGVESTPYLYVGFGFWCVLCLSYCAVILIWSFFKWTWTNIKIAIAEAKEL